MKSVIGNSIDWQPWREGEDGGHYQDVGMVSPAAPEVELEAIEQLLADGVVDYATVDGMKLIAAKMSDQDRQWFGAHPQRRLLVRPEHLGDGIKGDMTGPKGFRVRSDRLPRDDSIRFWMHPDEEGKFVIGDYVRPIRPARTDRLTAVLKIHIGVRLRFLLDPQDTPQQDTDAAIWRAVKRTVKRHGQWAAVQANIRAMANIGEDEDQVNQGAAFLDVARRAKEA